MYAHSQKSQILYFMTHGLNKIISAQVWRPGGGTAGRVMAERNEVERAIFTWSPRVSWKQKVKWEEGRIWTTFGNVNRVTLIIWTAETLTVHEARSLDIACTVQILTVCAVKRAGARFISVGVREDVLYCVCVSGQFTRAEGDIQGPDLLL